MTDTRQFIVRFDRRHDAEAIARIEQQPSMSEYIRELVRCDTSDENERLLQQLADVTESMGRVEERCAKLRELVRDMLSVIEDSEFDPMFERQGKRGPYYVEDPSWRVGIRDRARQLGVRVDG